MKQTQSAVPTNPSAASLGRDRREKSEISDIRRFCVAFWELPSKEKREKKKEKKEKKKEKRGKERGGKNRKKNKKRR